MTRRATRALLSILVAAWWLTVPSTHGAHAAGRAAGPAAGPAVNPPVELSVGGAVPDATSGTYLILPVALLAGAALFAGYAYVRRRRRTATRTTPGGGRWGGAAAGGAGWGTPHGPPATPLIALDRRTRRALVATDDAVRTSEVELGFATARSGDGPAKPFTEAVAHARDELTAAFRLRQQLDDAEPEDDATRRAMLEEILRRCGDADARLDAEAAAFDRLRALERTAPEALAAVETLLREQTGAVTTAEAALTAMRERYAESAAAPVSGNVEQAKDRLAFAATHVDRAHQELHQGDRSAAAARIRAAESAVDQSARLTRAVDRRAQELAEAVGKLTAALADTEADLAGARALLADTDVPHADADDRVPDPGEPLGDAVGRAADAGGSLTGTGGRATDARKPLGDADGRTTDAGRPLTGTGGRTTDARKPLEDTEGRTTGADADLAHTAVARGLLLPDTGQDVPSRDLPATDPRVAELRSRIGRAESVLMGLRAAVDSGRYDPLDALRRVEEADTALDQALAGAGRARALLDRALLTARSATGAADTYVTTRRGAVGAEARTRLAEARRRLDRAVARADDDPASALAEAQRSDALARRAQDLAEQDVRRYGNPDGAAGSGADRPGGAVLGGIVLDAGPAAFGGPATRGRL
ncbi:TPM domain-containing protein [Streptomyces sp. NPDC004788]